MSRGCADAAPKTKQAQKRLGKAAQELEAAPAFDVQLVNDDLEQPSQGDPAGFKLFTTRPCLIHGRSTSPKRVGLYFWSFNPVHLGHLVITTTCFSMQNWTSLAAVTPTSPHKQGVDLIPEDTASKW